MPTYEYTCEDCGREFEYFQSMSEAPKTECAECGGHLKRLIGAGAGLIFKGSGFYITDYKNKGQEPARSSGGKRTSTGSDTKPAETKPAETKPAASDSAPAKPGKTD